MRVCALSVLALGAASGAAYANRRLALQVYSERISEEGLDLVSSLLETLDEHTPLHGEELKALVNARISRGPGDKTGADQFRDRVVLGRQHFIEGRYAAAIKQLDRVRQQLLAKQRLIATDQTLRNTLHRATLFLAHANLRRQDHSRAEGLLSEAIRSSPDLEVSLVHYGPDLVRLYKKVRLDLRGRDCGTLLVETTPRGCMVFVNERYVGHSPTRVQQLCPGEYRVYVQRTGDPGRVHVGGVTSAGDHTLSIDFELDRALRTAPETVLLYSTAAAMKKYEQRHAVEVGRRLGVNEVLLLGIRRYRGRRVLRGTMLAVATSRPVREGLIALEPAAATPAAIKALGRFLVLGEPGDGVVVRGLAQPGESELAVSSRSSFGVLRWVALGTGIAAVGAGIPLMAINDSGSCGRDHCRDNYDTFGAGLGLAIGGGALVVGSAVLFVLHAIRGRDGASRSSTSIGPWFGRSAAGINARGCF